MLPGAARVVASMSRASDLQSAKNGRATSSACDSPCPAMRSTRVITRAAPARARQPLARERLRSSASARAADPAAARSTRSLVFQPQARARCRSGFGTIVRAVGHHRLPQVDVRHLQPAPGESRCAAARRSRGPRRIGRPSVSATTSRVRSSSVGPRPPVSTTTIRACQRRREDGAEVVARISHDGLRAHG